MASEIVNGLRNAIERGEPLEKAIQSFINAGYNSQEVINASKEVQLGLTTTLPQTKPQYQESTNPTQDQEQKPKKQFFSFFKKKNKPESIQKEPSGQQFQQQAYYSQDQQYNQNPVVNQSYESQQNQPVMPSIQKPKKKPKWIIIILVIALLILLGLLGLVFFADTLLKMIAG